MSTSKFKVELERRRNRYLNLYDYRASIDITDIQRMRYYNSYTDYINYAPLFSGMSANRPLPNKDEIERYFDYRDNVPHDCKLRIEFDRLFIYANDLAHLHYAVAKIAPTLKVRYYQVVAPRDVDTIEFSRKTEYQFRNYFKAKKISTEDRDTIKDFIAKQQALGAKIRLNDSMNRWLNSTRKVSYYYLSESYYVEYVDERIQMLLSLVMGEYLRPKIFKLVQRSSTV